MVPESEVGKTAREGFGGGGDAEEEVAESRRRMRRRSGEGDEWKGERGGKE